MNLSRVIVEQVDAVINAENMAVADKLRALRATEEYVRAVRVAYEDYIRESDPESLT